MAESTTEREARRQQGKAAFAPIEAPERIIRRPPEPAAPPTAPGRSSDQLKRMVRGQLSKVRADELVEALVELGYTRKEARARLLNAGVTDADDDTAAISKALAPEAATTPITPRQEEPAPEPGAVPAPRSTRSMEEEEPPPRTPSAPEAAVNTAVERVTPVLEDVQDWLASRRTPGGVGGLVLVIVVLWFAAIPVRGKDTRLSLLFKSLTGQVAVPVTPPQGTYDVAAHAGQWAEQVGTDIVSGVVRGVPAAANRVLTSIPPVQGPPVAPGFGAASTPAINTGADITLLEDAFGIGLSQAEQLLRDMGINP